MDLFVVISGKEKSQNQEEIDANLMAKGQSNQK